MIFLPLSRLKKITVQTAEYLTGIQSAKPRN
jgi:hypothetical protein